MNNNIRKNCRDIWWNAFMVQGAKFCTMYDIPECPTTATEIFVLC